MQSGPDQVTFHVSPSTNGLALEMLLAPESVLEVDATCWSAMLQFDNMEIARLGGVAGVAQAMEDDPNLGCMPSVVVKEAGEEENIGLVSMEAEETCRFASKLGLKGKLTEEGKVVVPENETPTGLVRKEGAERSSKEVSSVDVRKQIQLESVQEVEVSDQFGKTLKEIKLMKRKASKKKDKIECQRKKHKNKLEGLKKSYVEELDRSKEGMSVSNTLQREKIAEQEKKEIEQRKEAELTYALAKRLGMEYTGTDEEAIQVLMNLENE
ncbi:hypothetical protein QQ045_008479 [Rhodiola kirilowii]